MKNILIIGGPVRIANERKKYEKRLISILIITSCIFNIFAIQVNADSKKQIAKLIVTYMKAAKSYNSDRMISP